MIILEPSFMPNSLCHECSLNLQTSPRSVSEVTLIWLVRDSYCKHVYSISVKENQNERLCIYRENTYDLCIWLRQYNRIFQWLYFNIISIVPISEKPNEMEDPVRRVSGWLVNHRNLVLVPLVTLFESSSLAVLTISYFVQSLYSSQCRVQIILRNLLFSWKHRSCVYKRWIASVMNLWIQVP